MDLWTGEPRAVTDEDTWALSISPDGETLAAIGLERRHHALAGREAAPRGRCRGPEPGDRPVRWSADGESLWTFRRGEVPARVFTLDIATGGRRLWRTLVPSDAAGVSSIDELKITPSGHAYFYSYRRTLSELYEVAGAALSGPRRPVFTS